ncbi:MAG: hypothetical protein K2X81_27560, partial [Candidatus Obscuribacterales bacterium]|nr:hypothetical protein [Candidatus Obscuribacterales bacterium]
MTDVYYVIASNPHTPGKVLARLAQAPDHTIRRQVAANPHTPDVILAELARDEHWDVRLNVALNPVVSYSILEQ